MLSVQAARCLARVSNIQGSEASEGGINLHIYIYAHVYINIYIYVYVGVSRLRLAFRQGSVRWDLTNAANVGSRSLTKKPVVLNRIPTSSPRCLKGLQDGILALRLLDFDASKGLSMAL